MKKEYILVLPSWYPSKLDEFNGDFNERLVNAVSNYKNQIVVYVSTKKTNKLEEVEIFRIGNIITYKAYFLYSKYDLVNVIKMLKLYLSIFKLIFKEHGLPLLVHNYVFFPSGLISIYLKHRYKLKILLTEHWSIFNYHSNLNHIYKKSCYKRMLFSFILKSFDIVISVSKSLDESISEWTKNTKNYILPNVVNVDFFNRRNQLTSDSPFTFIHVSDMGLHKNVIGILNVFKKIIDNGFNVHLILVGKEKDEISVLIKKYSLVQYVKILGELPYQKVSEAMKLSKAFILFSKYENMPCVILEALCCGLPVISSNVGGISNAINQENGILVESENEIQLEDAIYYLMNNYNQFNADKISEKAIGLYNYNNIGKQINEIYLETLK